MIQKAFAEKMVDLLKKDDSVVGLAAGGSWITHELDEYSDIDLVLVTKEKITRDKTNMLDYVNKFGKLLTAFTGEHVGETRLLICLYDDPLLHVDIKFVTLEEFKTRIETPVILLDKDEQLKIAIENSAARFPIPGYQWFEDRFWTWVHYGAVKINRGEYFEAFDFLGAVRLMVLGPLLHMKNGKLPRGVRKAETNFRDEELNELKNTLPRYDKQSLIVCLKNAVDLYRKLRTSLFDNNIVLRKEAEKKVMEYVEAMEL